MKRQNSFGAAVFFLFLLAAGSAGGAELDFSWSLGEAELFFNGSDNPIDGSVGLGQFTLLADKKLGFSVQLFDMESMSGKNTISYSFLPLMAEYRFIDLGDLFYIALYGKAAWRWTQQRKGSAPPDQEFSGAGGLRFLLPIPLGLHYTANLSLFAEYGVPDGFKLGISVDALSVLLIWLVDVLDG
ncbi:MAG: hypothetical protein LBQ88_18220 [Treponema sp.]|jgi:hypothetical protein|nr:hypothetical protein [Treponema sp.]